MNISACQLMATLSHRGGNPRSPFHQHVQRRPQPQQAGQTSKLAGMRQTTMHRCTCDCCAATDAGKWLRERQRRCEARCHSPAGDAAEGACPCASSMLCCMAAVPAAAAVLASGRCCYAASALSITVCMSSPRE